MTCPSLPLQVRYRDDRLFQIDRFEVTYIAPSTVKQHHANESIFLEDGYLINTRSLGSCSPYICPSLGISRPSPAEARVPGASSAFPDPLVYRMQKLESFTGAFPPFLEHASLSRRILRRKAETVILQNLYLPVSKRRCWCLRGNLRSNAASRDEKTVDSKLQTRSHTTRQPCRNLPICAHSSAWEIVGTICFWF